MDEIYHPFPAVKMRQIVYIRKLQRMGGAVRDTKAAKATVREIDEVKAGAFFTVGMDLFPLDLDYVCWAKPHTGATSNAIVGPGLRELLELNVPAVGRTHVEILAWILNRNHRPVDASNGDPHACDQAPATNQDFFDHTHLQPSSTSHNLEIQKLRIAHLGIQELTDLRRTHPFIS